MAEKENIKRKCPPSTGAGNDEWNDQLGGYEILDEATRNHINDWAQLNGLGWGSEGSKLIQKLVISGAHVMNITYAHSWKDHKPQLNAQAILEKLVAEKIDTAP
jgi:hypothetical protein